MPETVDWVEVLWTVMAGIGVGVTSLGVWIAVSDARHARRAPAAELERAGIDPRDRPYLISIAYDLLRYETTALFLLLVFTGAGVRALLLPPNPAAGDAGTIALGLAFFAGALLLTVVSIQNRLSRRWRDRRDRREETHAE